MRNEKNNSNPAVLVLQDGTVYHGTAIGKIGIAKGEICFNTGMTGYQEVFTDPSYFGQILIETNVHIGNYGINNEDIESNSIKIAGLICKKFNEFYSRKSANKSVGDYFKSNEIVGISEIDTRALVRHVRQKGVMNAVISSGILEIEKLKEMVKSIPSMEGLELSSQVTCKEPFTIGVGNSKKVALLDLGVKLNIPRCLAERGCEVKIFPMHTSYEDMLAWNPSGFMISNGPGDPAAMPKVIETVKKCIESNIPVFGICLGHQIIAHASGIGTFKMLNGHRGLNHPVKNLITGKSEITSQNHGFSVKAEDVKKAPLVEVTHVNLNDNTIEGLRRTDKRVFSVQYHPEAAAGPHDSRYLFDDFVSFLN